VSNINKKNIMKALKKLNSYSKLTRITAILLLFAFLNACDQELLDEKPLSSLNTDIVLTSRNGFQNYLTALVLSARNELTNGDNFYRYVNNTDVASSAGAEYAGTYDWNNQITPTTGFVRYFWDWGYQEMILRANTIIEYASKPELAHIWESDSERNAVIAEARFFRAYTYNALANIYGGVPIVDEIFASPKFDFVRNTRQQVYAFAKDDLEYASQWLPPTVIQEGRIVKAAADHLLSEVYISLEEYDNAIASATDVINSGLYQLMTTRFGSEKDSPGDVFSDLFRDGNQNRSSGNLESIYVWQIEENTLGGGGTVGNSNIRNWAPHLANIKDPNGVPQLVADSLGRGVGRSRLSNHAAYGVWADNGANDMRNSKYNMRRVFYYNNPASAYFLQPIEPKTVREDTMRNIYPYSRKVDGKALNDNAASGRTAKDVMVFRLAETYLLRAEAHMKNGDPDLAAADINTVRNRANADPIGAGDVTMDYILDERIRELLVEEPRRRTLIRTGKLVERVRQYDILVESRNSIEDFHEFFPIPQTAIDANFAAEMKQNPGY
jgi:starch-binding outer membrane protein, SusD/RagB family